jgi:hypothetical protein
MPTTPHAPGIWTDRSTHDQPGSKLEAAFVFTIVAIASIVAAPIALGAWLVNLVRRRR